MSKCFQYIEKKIQDKKFINYYINFPMHRIKIKFSEKKNPNFLFQSQLNLQIACHIYYTFTKANRIVIFRNESIITNASLTYRVVFVKKEEKEAEWDAR